MDLADGEQSALNSLEAPNKEPTHYNHFEKQQHLKNIEYETMANISQQHYVSQ